MSRIYVSGTFDLTHIGHFNLFKKAKEMADEVVVSVNTDEFAAQFKRPTILSLRERMATIKMCKYVDEVIINTGGTDSKPAILKSKCNMILHGDDWKGESLMKQMGLTKEFLKKHKIKMVSAPYTKGISTTDIRNRIKKYVSNR